MTNGESYQLQYDTTQGPTPMDLASNIANRFHCWNSTVQGSASNGPPPPAAPSATVTLASCSAGPTTEYSYSAAVSSHTSSGAPAFSVATAASAMTPAITGIQIPPPLPPPTPTLTSNTPVTYTITGVEVQIGNPASPTYDYGGLLLFIYKSPVNAGPLVTQMVSYGQSSTAFSVASGFAARFQQPCSTAGTLFTAGAAVQTAVYNQATFTLLACQVGTSYSPSISLQYSNPSIPTPSFSASAVAAPAYSGLTVPAASYDSGTVTLQVNGTPVASVPYGSISTGPSIANALVTAGASNSMVTLGYSGSGLSLTAKSLDSYSYTVSVNGSFTQPSFTASSTSGSLLGGTNAPLFNWSTGYAPNGSVLAVTDSVMGTWTHAYDDLNRLIYSHATAGPQNSQQIFWDYDRNGNRWDQTVWGPQGGVQSHLSFSQSNNRIMDATYMYDTAGNVIYDGNIAYAYDAENRVVSLNGNPTYVYDANGDRVAKLGAGGTPTSIYILGAGGQQITEISGSGQWLYSNAYAGGSLVATYTPTTGAYHYNLTDWLGTKRMQTYASGNQEETCTSNPFGDSLSCQGGSDASEQHFTRKDHDTESGNDYFGARYYSSSTGRFMSPDPSGLSYADQNNPQSLNLYNYVLNRPLNLVDPTGLYHCESTSSSLWGWNGKGDPVLIGQHYAEKCYFDDGDGYTHRMGEISTIQNNQFVTPSNPFAPNNAQQQVIAASKWAEQKYCGANAGDRIFKSVWHGAAVGFGIGAVRGFVVGEIFGGEVSLGATGIPGALAGGVIQGVVGAMNGLTKGAVSAGACNALGVYK